MGWCPTCKVEHGAFSTICGSCRTELVTKLDNGEESYINYGEAYMIRELMTVNNLVKAEKLIYILKDNGIEASYRENDGENYLKRDVSSNAYGITIYVKNKYYDDAVNIIRAYNQEVRESQAKGIKKKKGRVGNVKFSKPKDKNVVRKEEGTYIDDNKSDTPTDDIRKNKDKPKKGKLLWFVVKMIGLFLIIMNGTSFLVSKLLL